MNFSNNWHEKLQCMLRSQPSVVTFATHRTKLFTVFHWLHLLIS
jgi:hypothetical protein